MVEAMSAIRTCRLCGCTDERTCAFGCTFIERDLCSACEQLSISIGEWMITAPVVVGFPDPALLVAEFKRFEAKAERDAAAEDKREDKRKAKAGKRKP